MKKVFYSMVMVLAILISYPVTSWAFENDEEETMILEEDISDDEDEDYSGAANVSVGMSQMAVGKPSVMDKILMSDGVSRPMVSRREGNVMLYANLTLYDNGKYAVATSSVVGAKASMLTITCNGHYKSGNKIDSNFEMGMNISYLASRVDVSFLTGRFTKASSAHAFALVGLQNWNPYLECSY